MCVEYKGSHFAVCKTQAHPTGALWELLPTHTSDSPACFLSTKGTGKKQLLGQLENGSAYFSKENPLGDDTHELKLLRAASQTPQVISLLNICQTFHVRLLCMSRFPPSSREFWTSRTHFSSQNKPPLIWHASLLQAGMTSATEGRNCVFPEISPYREKLPENVEGQHRSFLAPEHSL